MSNVAIHSFVSAKADGSDATKVQPSNWNAGHQFQGGANGNLLMRDTSDATYGAGWTSLVWDDAALILKFGGTTASFPALKRSGSALQARLADDSDYATFYALSQVLASQLEIGTNPSTGGLVRLPHANGIYFRNSTNASNIKALAVGTVSSDVIEVGQAGNNVTIYGDQVRIGGDLLTQALIALGGGAAPTLGTIGGSGPAAAAQNSWARFLDAAGAAYWVPAWK